MNTIPSIGVEPAAVSPATSPDQDEEDDNSSESEADGQSSSSNEYVPLLTSRHFKEYRVKEPWYFKIIEAWFYFNIAIGLLVFLAIVIGFTIEIVNTSRELGLKHAFAVALASYIVWIIGVFGFLAGWAFMLLVLDAARNLRAIRHAAMRMSGATAD